MAAFYPSPMVGVFSPIRWSWLGGARLLPGLIVACWALASSLSGARAALPPPPAGTQPASPEARAEAARRAAALQREIAYHDERYHRQGEPEISDFAYDELRREWAALVEAFPELASGIREGVGDDRTGLFPAHRHRVRMGSLDKTFTESELRLKHGRLAAALGQDDLTYVVEPKIDGLAVSVTYEGGVLTRAATRGDGEVGEDVTAQVQALGILPERLRAVNSRGQSRAPPEIVELRGEVYATHAQLRRVNHERELQGEPPFANPRSLAVGTLRQRDAREVARRQLGLVIFGVGACVPADWEPATYTAWREQWRAWGLPVLTTRERVQGVEALWAAVQALGRRREREAWPTDGVVIKLEAIAQQRQAGGSERAPRWAWAHKFAPERVETQLLGITLQVGRTGAVTPVAELAPVKVGGSVVRRATLHHREHLARLDLRLGDFVYLEKAGDVIPAIVGVNTARRAPESQPYRFPDTCPSCASPLVWMAPAARCPLPSCPEQVRRRGQHFAAKSAVGIEGLGEALIEHLVASGRVRSVADLYRLRRDDLRAIPRMGETRAARLLAAIERSKRAELWRFVYGLGIRQVGPAAAKDVARVVGGWEKLATVTPEDLRREQAGVVLSEGTVRALLAFLDEDGGRALVSELAGLGVDPRPPDP